MLDLSKVVIYPDNNNPEIYHGCITVENESFKIKFSNPTYLISNTDEKRENIICEMDGKLSEILYESQAMIEKRLFQCNTAEQFINEIYNILYKTMDTSCIAQNISHSFYSKICHELDNIGWQCVKQISYDMTQFILTPNPKSFNKHELYFKILDANNFPKSKPVLITNRLPLSFEFQWTSNYLIHHTMDTMQVDNDNDSDHDDDDDDDQQEIIEKPSSSKQSKYNHIGNVLKQYNMECKKYGIFWKILEDFYKNTIILEPQEIDYGCNILRILLDKTKKTTMEITFNPLNCENEKCQCKFYGIQQEIQILQQEWNENAEELWNEDLSPRINIQNILNITFINKYPDDYDYDDNYNIDQILSDMECSMCLEFKTDDNMIPNITCNHCRKTYHKTCLLEWFDSLDTINHSYTSIDGKCPQCAQNISITIIDSDSL